MSAFWSLVAGAPGCRCQSAVCAWSCRVPLQRAAGCRCRAQAPKHLSGVNADVFFFIFSWHIQYEPCFTTRFNGFIKEFKISEVEFR